MSCEQREAMRQECKNRQWKRSVKLIVTVFPVLLNPWTLAAQPPPMPVQPPIQPTMPPDMKIYRKTEGSKFKREEVLPSYAEFVYGLEHPKESTAFKKKMKVAYQNPLDALHHMDFSEELCYRGLVKSFGGLESFMLTDIEIDRPKDSYIASFRRIQHALDLSIDFENPATGDLVVMSFCDCLLRKYESRVAKTTVAAKKTGCYHWRASHRSCRFLTRGRWLFPAWRCRSASRLCYGPGLRDYGLGFRVSRVPAEAVAKTRLDAGTNTNATTTGNSPSLIKIGKFVFEGGDGSSIEQAVLIKNAKDEEEGVNAEAKWISKVHPGWKKGNQALLSEKGRSYDRIEYATPKGETKTACFDITEFFGK